MRDAANLQPMEAVVDSPFGIGIYTVSEAALLTGVAGPRLRRWLRGYRFSSTWGAERSSPPLWASELPSSPDEQLLLSFRDLIEARWVSFFRDQRVPWLKIREVAARVAEELRVSHPFSTGRFAAVITGKRHRPSALIAEQYRGRMREVLSNQALITEVMAPFVRQLEIKRDKVLRWFPLEGSRRVVIDPDVRFGAPVVASGVPTEILWRNYRFGGATYRALARWWDVPESEVKDAVRPLSDAPWPTDHPRPLLAVRPRELTAA